MALRLAAFDLDGTLLRGQTACEAIAKGIGRIERMRELERLESTDIEEMAEWYSDFTFSDLCNHLAAVRVAPGIDEGFALLREHGFKIAIVSLTWQFAVEWFADRLGAGLFSWHRAFSGRAGKPLLAQRQGAVAKRTG